MGNVAIFNPKGKTIHHLSGRCGHISPWSGNVRIESWDSAEGKRALIEGHACRSCMSQFNFVIPVIVKDDVLWPIAKNLTADI